MVQSFFMQGENIPTILGYIQEKEVESLNVEIRIPKLPDLNPDHQVQLMGMEFLAISFLELPRISHAST
jgi:hypothetical protein